MVSATSLCTVDTLLVLSIREEFYLLSPFLNFEILEIEKCSSETVYTSKEAGFDEPDYFSCCFWNDYRDRCHNYYLILLVHNASYLCFLPYNKNRKSIAIVEKIDF